MSFLKKAMTNVLGVGKTTIGLLLDDESFHPGSIISGAIHIHGGKIEQLINGVNISIKAKYMKEKKDKNDYIDVLIQTHEIALGKVILPGEFLKIPFSFKLNENTPISLNKYPLKISTNLDIAKAIDSYDNKSITVLPTQHIDNIFLALKDIGFRLTESKNIYSRRKIHSYPFVQEFEFIPTDSSFKRSLDEIELVLLPHMHGIDLYLEIDRKATNAISSIAEALSFDESHIKVEISYEDLENLEELKEILFSEIFPKSRLFL